MTNCERFKDSLSDMIDNQVTPSIRKEMESHMGQCKSCADDYHRTVSLKSILNDMSKVQASCDFDSRLRASLAREIESGEKKLFNFNWNGNSTKVTVGASAIALASLTFFIVQNSNREITAFPQADSGQKIESKISAGSSSPVMRKSNKTVVPSNLAGSNMNDKNIVKPDTSQNSTVDIPKQNLEDKIRVVKQK